MSSKKNQNRGPTGKIIYFTRHAQAYHNVAEDYSIRDAELTPLGKEQSKKLYEDTKDTFQKTAELVVSSPLRRPMETMLIGYSSLIERITPTKPIILLPSLQEVENLPCDTGSARSDLEADPRFSHLDFANLDSAPAVHGEEHEWTSKKGYWSPQRVAERANWVRNWLRSREEREIVVVAHGDILRMITDGYRSATPWANAEVKIYTFESADDEDAKVVQIGEGPTEGKDLPTGEDLKN